jgi:hypothetical protein
MQPGQGGAGKLGRADIQGAVDPDGKAQPAAGPYFGGAHAAGLAVGVLDQANPGKLVEGGAERMQFGLGIVFSKK